MKVFISYAREDIETARKLRDDLEKSGIKTWLDKEDLLPGQNWREVILREIRESRYFIAMLSSNALSKEGFVHKELKTALDYLDNFPSDRIFVIPVRIDECKPTDEKLQYIHWADLFPSYEDGLSQILKVLKMEKPEKRKISEKKQNSDKQVSQKQELKPSEAPRQPGRQFNIPTWLTVIVLSAIIIAGIIRFYPSEKKTTTDSSVKIAAPTPTPKPDPPVVVTPPPAQKTFTNSLGMKFVPIPAGWFMMGSPKDEPGRSDDETQHKVTISEPFFMQTTEVTQGQWKAVMGNNPSSFKDCGDNCPVENVSWDDIQDFIKKLNRKGEGTYRLPTEAEWEYAARAGSQTAFSNGDIAEKECGNDPNLSKAGWYCGNAGGKTHEVGQKQPNAWGLYDMHGNVWEWCQDWYGNYPFGAVTDPTGPDSGSSRVLRGGSWGSGARICRAARRSSSSPGYGGSNCGFRLVRP
jgi:formylglycine-generating enzyme required for sulfatase activity